MSVRATEEIVSLGTKSRNASTKKASIIEPHLLEVADRLSGLFDTRVSVQSGKAKGKITIEFSGNEDLERIIDLLED